MSLAVSGCILVDQPEDSASGRQNRGNDWIDSPHSQK